MCPEFPQFVYIFERLLSVLLLPVNSRQVSMLICAASNRFCLETIDKEAKPQQSEEVEAG